MIALITVQPYWMEKVLVHVMDFLPANQLTNITIQMILVMMICSDLDDDLAVIS